MKGCAAGQKLGNGVTWYVLNVRHVLAACKCFYQCGVNYYYAGFSMFDALPQGLFKTRQKPFLYQYAAEPRRDSSRLWELHPRF